MYFSYYLDYINAILTKWGIKQWFKLLPIMMWLDSKVIVKGRIKLGSSLKSR